MHKNTICVKTSPEREEFHSTRFGVSHAVCGADISNCSAPYKPRDYFQLHLHPPMSSTSLDRSVRSVSCRST